MLCKCRWTEARLMSMTSKSVIFHFCWFGAIDIWWRKYDMGLNYSLIWETIFTGLICQTAFSFGLQYAQHGPEYLCELFVPSQADHQDIPSVLLLIIKLIFHQSYCPATELVLSPVLVRQFATASQNISRDSSLYFDVLGDILRPCRLAINFWDAVAR